MSTALIAFWLRRRRRPSRQSLRNSAIRTLHARSPEIDLVNALDASDLYPKAEAVVRSILLERLRQDAQDLAKLLTEEFQKDAPGVRVDVRVEEPSIERPTDASSRLPKSSLRGDRGGAGPRPEHPTHAAPSSNQRAQIAPRERVR